MKRLAIVVVGLACLGLAPRANAQATDYLRFYSDVAGTTCFLNYTDIGVATVHIFQTGPVRSAALQFSAIAPACWSGATWLGDAVNGAWLSLGSSQDPVYGLSVATSGCQDLPLYVGSINHLVTDLSVECCEYAPGPIEDARVPGTLQYVDCTNPSSHNWVIRPLQPVGLTVNSNPSCPCEQPLAATTTTWGRVKALYRQ